MAGMSRNALSKRLSNPAPAEHLHDVRAAALSDHLTVDDAYTQTVADVFRGTTFLQHEAKVQALLAARGEVGQHWAGMRDSFLSIGRALISLEEQLTTVEVSLLAAGTERLFPFSKSVASQLRTVARCVDSGRISQEMCPSTYSTAYQIARLDNDDLELAREEGLIRPDVTRSALIAFRNREERTPIQGRELRSMRREQLIARRARLRRQIEQVERQLADLDRE